MTRGSLAAVLCLAAGCGGTDPGSGSGTLFTVLEASGRADRTRVRVELKLRGNPVLGANVVVTDTRTGESKNLDGSSGGEYTATFNGYAQTLRLAVTSGEDHLEATLEGPAPHTITRPPQDAIVRRADFEFLDVQWQADGPSDAVIVTAEGVDPIELEGTNNSVRIPLGGLVNGDQSVSVERASTVPLAGGAQGSLMRIRFQVDNRFTLEG